MLFGKGDAQCSFTREGSRVCGRKKECPRVAMGGDHVFIIHWGKKKKKRVYEGSPTPLGCKKGGEPGEAISLIF